MFGQGNYGPPTGQGPYTSTTSTFHQHPSVPTLPHFSQGSQLPRSTMVQHGPQSVSPQVGQPGHLSYQQTPPGPHQPGPPFPISSSGANTQPYLTPAPLPPPTQPLQAHGSSQMPQHSQWIQNAHFVPPTVPSIAPRVLLPPPSQGQNLYGSQVHQPPLSVMQAHPSPHQSASNFFMSPPAFGHSVPQHSNMPATGLPPLPRPRPLPPPPPPPPLPTSPPGAPPLPPSSPPPTSSFPFLNSHITRPNPTVSSSAFRPQYGSEIDRTVCSVDEVSASSLGGDDASKHDGSGNCGRESAPKMGFSYVENPILELPPAPPKPVDDRTVRRIEVLCQFIAKNGPEFEDMTRQKEFGNPEFKFLSGGEPGSENAVAYEYFIWMKYKCQLAFKSTGNQGTNASPVRQLGDSLSRRSVTTNICLPPSPVDSDMDMEDDITHPDEELQIDPSNNPSHGIVSVSNDPDMNDQLQLQSSLGNEHSGNDALDGNSPSSESSGLEEQRQGSKTSSDQNQFIMRKSATRADGSVVNSSRNVESPLDSKVLKSFYLHEDLSQQNATADVVESSSEKLPEQLVNGASPFRLLQDYASEGSSDDEAHVEDAIPSTVTPSIEVHSTIHDTAAEENFGADLRRRSLSGSNEECEPLSECCKSEDFPFKSETVIMEPHMITVVGKSENFVDNIYSDQAFVKDGVSHGALHEKEASTDANVHASVDKEEDTVRMSTKLKVDEFGRLIKEGASDSDSDGSPCYTRRRSKRDRSRSRSRSPHDRRRRRRSPWERKDRRGRSRSFSPKRRRSRSKSPLYWDGEYPGDKMRRDKGQFPECFDFRRGRCYRGASCRYLHHEDKSDRSRSHRSKQPLQDLPHGSRRSDFNEKNANALHKKLSHKHDEARFQGLKPLEHMPGIGETKLQGEPAAEPSNKGCPTEPGILQNPVDDPVKLPSHAAHVTAISAWNLDPEQSQGHHSDQVFQKLDQQHEKMDKSSASESSPIETSASLPSQIPGDKPYLKKDSISVSDASMNKSENIPFQSMIPQESIPPALDGISHLPSSSFPLISQEMSASYAQQVPSALRSASVENFPAYHASISYSHPQFPVPPNPTWNSLPPPSALPHPPRPLSANNMIGTSAHGHYSDRPIHFQQNMLPLMNQFLSQTSSGPYVTEFPTVSDVGQNQAYPLMQQPDRPSRLQDDLQPGTFSTSHSKGQLHGGPALVGEDRFTVPPLQGLYSLNSYMPENLHSQALPFSRESPSKRVQGFPTANLPSADSISSLPGDEGKVSSTMSRYTSDLLDRSQPSRSSDFGGSRISRHYNPYASTFEQPLSSKRSSNILIQEKDLPYGSNIGAAYSFSRVLGNGRAVSLGSRNVISPQNTIQGAGGTLLRPIGDQYDPLYDSIEPSSNSVRKPGQNLEATDESDDMIRLSGSNKPLDVEENNKQKGVGTVAVTTSLENEEYGETADAEVGAVEDGSPSSPNDVEDTAAEEVEIDQVKAHGKSKNKDSRSMKLFKVALANFVKEVLKPSWRQGNMSKEAFKTIVKKTVDKVSGAMKSHQIPKSQTKINRYIDSSQRKLTKLVMGYVDKYVKV